MLSLLFVAALLFYLSCCVAACTLNLVACSFMCRAVGLPAEYAVTVVAAALFFFLLCCRVAEGTHNTVRLLLHSSRS